MPLLRLHNFAISLDGFGAGEGQTLDTPFGHAGDRLMRWFFPTRTFVAATGHDAEAVGTGTRGVDDAFAAAAWDGIGAEIMGRRKFGPQEGPWQDDGWRGWWGEEPPFHTPVVVLTHHDREDLAVGDTTFLFRDLSPRDALALATDQAGGLDVRLGGGVDTVRQFITADLVDHMHIVVVPIILGRGEHLWSGLEGMEERFVVDVTPSPSGVVHYVFTRRPR